MKADVKAMLFSWCRQANVPEPVAEYRFHPERKWRFDWAWPDVKVAVEIHGKVWTGGRHTRGGGFEADREKINTAQLMGWIVIEASTGQVERGQLFEWLEAMPIRTAAEGDSRRRSAGEPVTEIKP